MGSYIQRFDQRFGIVADSSCSHTKENREHHQLQYFIVGHGLHKAFGYDMFYKILKREALLLGDKVCHALYIPLRKVNILARLEVVHQCETNKQGSQRCSYKPKYGLTSHPSHCFQITQFGNTYYQGCKNQRGNDHLHQPDKNGAQYFDIDGEAFLKIGSSTGKNKVSNKDTQDHGKYNI